MKSYVCLLLLLVHCSTAAHIEVNPVEVPPLMEEDNVILTLRLHVNFSDPLDKVWHHGAFVMIVSENEQVHIDNTSFALLPGTNMSISVTAERFGYDWLRFNVKTLNNESDYVKIKNVLQEVNMTRTDIQDLSFRLKLRLLRRENALDIIFIICISVFIIINNVNMGCILDLEVLKSVLKKPVGPIVGFCSQFLFMPLAAYGVGLGLLDSPSVQLGLFTLGCCPGGTGSNFWTFLFRGDVNLSVVMTFVSTIAALGMMPLWLFTLGQEFFQEDGQLSIPYDQLLITLVSFGVPVGVGTLIRYCRPNWAKKSEKIIRPYTIFLLVFFLTIGVYTNWYIIRLMTWQIVLSGVIVAWGGYIFGGLAACLFCMTREQVIAISIETALQNPGVAFVLLKISLPQPEADFASVSPVAQLMVTGIPLWVMYIIYCIQRRKETKAKKAFKLRAMAAEGKTIEKTSSRKRWHQGKNDKEGNVHLNNESSGPLQPKSLGPKKPIGLSNDLWISAPIPMTTDDESVSKSLRADDDDDDDSDDEDEIIEYARETPM